MSGPKVHSSNTGAMKRARTFRPTTLPAARVAGACVLMLMLAVSGCSSTRLGGDALRLSEGTSVMVERDGQWRVLAQGDTAPDGVRVRTGISVARLELQRGRVWLGPSALVRINGDALEIEHGEIVVDSPGGMRSVWQTVQVSGEGTYRISPGASPRVGVYRGGVIVRRPGEQRELPALRQLGLDTRRLAATPDPLQYSTDDAWDQELLPAAIAFDNEVATLARGIDREYGMTPRPAAFYSSFTAVRAEILPSLAATARTASADGFGPPSDALITLFVASAAAKASGNPLDTSVTEIAERRASGARWGLLSIELGIGVKELGEAVDLARDQRQIVAPGERRGGGGGPTPRPTASGTPSPRPTPTGSPSPSPSPSPTNPGPGGALRDTIEGILGGG